MQKLLPYCLVLGALLGSITASAQFLTSDNPSLAAIQSAYEEAIGHDSRIFNGTEYAIRYSQVVDHQYLTGDWQPGAINFLDRVYDGLELRYDIVNDIVVLKYFHPIDGSMMSVKPAQEKINGFNLQSLRFVQLDRKLTGDTKTGFYEVIFEGKYQVYARHKKEQFIDKSRGAPVIAFQHKIKLFLAKEGEFIAIRNRGNLLKVLADEKKELKAYARSRNMVWKSNPRRNAAILVSYYLELKDGRSE